ncbi:MAG: hypothetical protein E4H20_00015 [Spirochaetales bacterium]|nr:MAG: hypothetical protein E4H20_00015 [Spirochaetales bacterium]
MRRVMIIFLALSLVTVGIWAQDEGGFNFQAGIVLGTDVITDQAGNPETWNNLGFQPDLGFGKFGIGFDFTMRFHLMPSDSEAIEVYPGDWVPDYEGSGKSLLDLYLPKIMYFRYGMRGDPLYAKLGSIEDLTLGNGFIVGNYANTRFLPGQRIFGLQLNLDGGLFDFPFVGLELLTGNLAQLDVIGGRLYIRPMVTTGLPLLEDLQVGVTAAMDNKPELYVDTPLGNAPVAVYGADLFLPLIKSQLFPLAAFTEIAFEPNDRTGFMVGAGGRLVGIITYGAQLRILGAGFIPVYFDANYDVFRALKSDIMETTPTGDGSIGWLAKAGMSLLDDKLFFDVSMDGPFKAIPAVAALNPNQADYPHLRGVAGIGEGFLGGFFFDFSYEKYFLGMDNSFFADLVDPNNAVITAAVNFRTGAAVFTLLYNLTYNPDSPNNFDVTSSLQSSIKF